MSVFRRGGIYWYEFQFNGARIRESAKTSGKTVAREAERQRRRELEMGVNRIPRGERTPLFKVAAEHWRKNKNPRSRFTALHYTQYVNSLSEIFGKHLVCDITADDIADLQKKRESEGKSGRTINAEVGVLRQILKRYRLWNGLAESGAVKFKRERRDIGRALSHDDEQKLLDAARESRSVALFPLFVVSIDSGLRASEIRHLRRHDLRLTWRDGLIESGEIIVSRSKTEGGTGRIVPLTRRVCAVLSVWLERFSEADAESYVFPSHCVGFAGNKREPRLYDIDLAKPIGEWKSAWNLARETAGLDYRWHDLRHTFISRLAENPMVSEQTITALAGHVSKRMLERYSHIRAQAKRDAIATLETANSDARSPQKSPQLTRAADEATVVTTERVLN
jgi:integrase